MSTSVSALTIRTRASTWRARGILIGAATGLALLGGWLAYGRLATADSCTAKEWPFSSISCEFFELSGRRADSAESQVAQVRISEAEVTQAAIAFNGSGSRVVEARLVYLWSPRDDGTSDTQRALRWAVSVELPGGIRGPNESALYTAQADRVRGPANNRPLTPAEDEIAARNVRIILDAWRSSLKDSYHLDFFDPETGEWTGASENVRTDQEKFKSLLPPDLRP